MATYTYDVSPYFAVGATVGAYLRSSYPQSLRDTPDGVAAPVAATATAVVSSTGTVAYTGLADGVEYWLGTGLTPYDYVSVRTTTPSSSGGSGSGVATAFVGGATYAAGQLAASPAGDTIRRLTAGTAAATFTVAESANWVTVSPRLGVLEKRDMWVFGHSYPAGQTAGSFAQRLFNRHAMGTYTDRASAGTNAGQMAEAIRAVALGEFGSLAASTVVLMSMINDVGQSTPTATVLEEYRSVFAQLGSTRNLITSNAFVFGSGWTTGVSTTPGSFFDYSFVGDTAYLLMGFTTGAAVNFDVVRSGTGGAAYSSFNTGGYFRAFPGVVKFSGFGDGNHTIRVTYTSGTQATVYMGLIPYPYAPTVLWAQEGPIPNFGADGSAGNTLMTTTYPAAVAAILSDFPYVVPVPPVGWDSATMVHSDLVHPNDRGNKYWADRLEQAVRTLDFRQGQNVMFTITAPSITRASSYSTGTVDQVTSYTNLKTWASDAGYIYSNGTNLPTLAVGMSIVITGGTGWTPGNYQIVGVNLAFGTPDGTRNMYQVVRNPNYLNNTAPAAAAGTAGGIGRISA